MVKRNAVLFVLATLTVLAAACTRPVGPQDSQIPAPSVWNRLVSSSATQKDVPFASGPEVEIDQQWWRHFGDPTLDELIKQALDNNKSLQIAKARVEEARAGRRAARSQLLPVVNAGMGAQRTNLGYFTNNSAVTFFEDEVVGTWEFDLFGRNQARTAAAAAIMESEEAARQAVRVGLLAEVARNYFAMRDLERQIDLTRQNLDLQKKTLALVQGQKQGTKASEFDVQRASAQVSATESLIPALKAGRDSARNRLNVLLGLAPGSLEELLNAPWDLKPLDQLILVAAPAKVLAERPDVRSAERIFAASISAKYVAQTAWLPQISLMSFFGAQSFGTSALQWANPWARGFNVILPALNFERIMSQIDSANAQQKQAFLNYQQTVLLALENMENVLSSYSNELNRNASLADNVKQNSTAAELVKHKYSSGYASLLDVLVAEMNQLVSQSSHTASDFNLRNDLVSIYSAAGGGWKGMDSKDEPRQLSEAK